MGNLREVTPRHFAAVVERAVEVRDVNAFDQAFKQSIVRRPSVNVRTEQHRSRWTVYSKGDGVTELFAMRHGDRFNTQPFDRLKHRSVNVNFNKVELPKVHKL